MNSSRKGKHIGVTFSSCVWEALTQNILPTGFLRTPLTHCLENLPQNRDSRLFFSLASCLAYLIKVLQRSSIRCWQDIWSLSFVIGVAEVRIFILLNHNGTIIFSYLFSGIFPTAGCLLSFSSTSKWHFCLYIWLIGSHLIQTDILVFDQKHVNILNPYLW